MMLTRSCLKKKEKLVKIPVKQLSLYLLFKVLSYLSMLQLVLVDSLLVELLISF
jgi:hypothetical protein